MTVVIPVPAPHDIGTCRVLVADPVLNMRRDMRGILSSMGCQTVHDTGKTCEAWDALRQDRYDMLFLDWSEEIDAPAFLTALRAEENDLRFLPVVVMTAYCRPENVNAARDCGGTEFMLRPFTADVVASRVNAILHHPRLFIADGTFFGPDRRRRRQDWPMPERRKHQNWQADERRATKSNTWYAPERRQGRSGFEPLERRAAQRV